MQKTKKQVWIVYALIAQVFVGVVGSLYLSAYGDPIANIISGNIFPIDSGLLPCTLCWFGRILFYPLLPIVLVGYLKSDKNLPDYILPLSISGTVLTAYHYGTQKLGFAALETCSASVPCDEIQLEYLGFITIPLLACVGFAVITMLAFWLKKSE